MSILATVMTLSVLCSKKTRDHVFDDKLN